jgi:hypothetical protein
MTGGVRPGPNMSPYDVCLVVLLGVGLYGGVMRYEADIRNMIDPSIVMGVSQLIRIRMLWKF